jgi:hypothetical protein
LSGCGRLSPTTCSLDTYHPFLISFTLSFRKHVICGKQEPSTFFQSPELTIPSSHPDCSFRDTIFLVSSPLYTCTLHYTTSGQHHTLSPLLCRLVSLLCYYLGSCPRCLNGTLDSCLHWADETNCTDERISSKLTYTKRNKR